MVRMGSTSAAAAVVLQTWAFVLLAVVGGYVASLFTAFNTWVCLLRKRWSKWFSFRIAEVGHWPGRVRHLSICLSVPLAGLIAAD